MTWRIGVADTTFSRVDMGSVAVEELGRLFPSGRVTVLRRVVPGIKDLPVACKRLLEEEGCHMVLACGMAGPEPVDKTCAHEASTAIQSVMLSSNKHVLEVFVHMDEVDAGAEEALHRLAVNRVQGHCENCFLMLERPERMLERAGQGVRQGFPSVGPARPARKTAP